METYEINWNQSMFYFPNSGVLQGLKSAHQDHTMVPSVEL